MAIKIFKDRIQFDNFALTIRPEGLCVNSVVSGSTTNATATFTAARFDGINTFGGNDRGFMSGGFTQPNVTYVLVDSYSYIYDAPGGSDIIAGNLSTARALMAGTQSSIDAYTSGGYTAPGIRRQMIDKFPFASNYPAVVTGQLTVARYNNSGTGSSSNTASYTSGGYSSGSTTAIDKFPFALEGNATSVGNLTVSRTYASGCTSTTHGYAAGGTTFPGQTNQNVIDKWPFASDTNATDVGDLLTTLSLASASSSNTHGYLAGGGWPGAPTNVIQRFAFATDGNSSDIADLTAGRYGNAGSSAKTAGFSAGGFSPSAATALLQVDRYTFASAFNAVTITNLTTARGYAAGQQS